MQEYYVEVGTVNYKEYLYRKLSELRSKEGLPIEFYELKDGASYLVRCVYSSITGKQDKDRLTARIYNYYFARALAEIIFQSWEGGFIRRILKKEYSMNHQDIEAIVEKAWKNINKEDKTYLPETRKHVLVKSILEFLDTHTRFEIEGFMNFRADLYKRELRKQIARAVNEYALEQEHEGFVHLLKRFVNSQHTIYKTMHLVIKEQGEVEFFDDHGRNINEECLKENCSIIKDTVKDYTEKDNVELYEDFLISAILKCAPSKLVIHPISNQYEDMIQIIYEVFEEKVSFCQGCAICGERN